MIAALAVLRRELHGYFYTPLGWVIATLFLLIQGYAFYLLLELVVQYGTRQGDVVTLFFGGTLLYWLFLMVLIAVCTMRLFAEEERSGTLEPLLVAPVSTSAIVLAKYLAALLYYAVLWVPTGVYMLVLQRLSHGTALDYGAVAAGYLGTLSVGAACLAVGLCCSALTRHQLVAAMSTIAVLSLLVLLGPLSLFTRNERLKAIIDYINLFSHMDDFSRGIVDSRRLTMHLSLIVACLVATVQRLDARRSR